MMELIWFVVLMQEGRICILIILQEKSFCAQIAFVYFIAFYVSFPLWKCNYFYFSPEP